MTQLTARAPFIEHFLGTLLAPVETFKRLGAQARETSDQGLPVAFAVVATVCALDGLRITSGSQMQFAAMNMMMMCTLGLLIWFLSGSVIALVASCFKAPVSNIRASYVTLGWSALPLLFAAPVSALEPALGGATVLLLNLILLWTFVLAVIAVTASYEMKGWQALALIIGAPALLGTLQFLQFLQGLMTILPGLLD